MREIVDDKNLDAAAFIRFVNQIWPGDYDLPLTQAALAKTMNITIYDGEQLVGCLRILTDGYFFGTITELLVLPAYQKKGIGSRLLQLAKGHTPTMLYFGAQPGIEPFYEKNGASKACNPMPSPKALEMLPADWGVAPCASRERVESKIAFHPFAVIPIPPCGARQRIGFDQYGRTAELLAKVR